MEGGPTMNIAQNRSFSNTILPMDDLLDMAINWIKINLSPDDVFNDDVLKEWAIDNGFKEDES